MGSVYQRETDLLEFNTAHRVYYCDAVLTMMTRYSASERSATSRSAEDIVCTMSVLRPNLSNSIPDQDKDKSLVW